MNRYIRKRLFFFENTTKKTKNYYYIYIFLFILFIYSFIFNYKNLFIAFIYLKETNEIKKKKNDME